MGNPKDFGSTDPGRFIEIYSFSGCTWFRPDEYYDIGRNEDKCRHQADGSV